MPRQVSKNFRSSPCQSAASSMSSQSMPERLPSGLYWVDQSHRTCRERIPSSPRRRAVFFVFGCCQNPTDNLMSVFIPSPIRRSWTGTARKPPPLQTSSVPLKIGFRLRPGRRTRGTTPYRYVPGEARRPTRHVPLPGGPSRPTGRSRGRKSVWEQAAERRFPPHPQRMGRHAVPPDLCRPRHGAYVQREIELQIQIVEELPRRRPVVFDA